MRRDARAEPGCKARAEHRIEKKHGNLCVFFLASALRATTRTTPHAAARGVDQAAAGVRATALAASAKVARFRAATADLRKNPDRSRDLRRAHAHPRTHRDAHPRTGIALRAVGAGMARACRRERMATPPRGIRRWRAAMPARRARPDLRARRGQ